RRALDLFSRIEDRAFELSVLHSLASVHFESGAIDEAEEVARRCVALARTSKDERTEAIADVILARVALARDDADQALTVAKRAEKAFAENDRQRADALRVVGAAHDKLGAFPASDRAYR